MLSLRIEPLADAVRQMDAKTPVGARLRSDEWEQVPAQLRELAFFSSRIEDMRFLNQAKERLQRTIGLQRDASGGLVDKDTFIAEMRRIAEAQGLAPRDPDKKGGLQDPTSAKRLGLVFEANTEFLEGYARHKIDQDPDILDAYPCQELIRVEARVKRRRWVRRWLDAGGKLYEGRMIAPKNDPIWTRISRFGLPYPPYDWNSGMGLRDVSREEAERLGVIAVDQVIPPLPDPGLSVSVSRRGLSQQQIRDLRADFGDKISVTKDSVKWSAPPPVPKTAAQRRRAVDELVANLAKETDAKAAHQMLMGALKVPKPLKTADIVQTPLRGFSQAEEARITKHIDALLEITPRNLVRGLPKLSEIDRGAAGAGSVYEGSTEKIEYGGGHVGRPYFEERRAVWHELTHWLHIRGPSSYQAALDRHYRQRTAKDPVVSVSKVDPNALGREDQWLPEIDTGDKYAGRDYYLGQAGSLKGYEIPTIYMEYLAEPKHLAQALKDDPETLKIVLRILFHGRPVPGI